MPAPLLHIFGALQLQKENRLPEALGRAAANNPRYYRLGALLVDLPLFDRFGLKVALFLVKQPYPESSWATVIHTRGTARLTEALLRRATGERREQMLAVVAGLLTHLAFDRAMHPAIEEAVARHVRPTETPAQLHEALENYQCLVFHRAHLGCDGLGTSRVDLIVLGPDGTGRLPRWFARELRHSLGEVYGTTPDAATVDRWARGLHGYRTLLRTPVARIGIKSSEHLAKERPWVASVELATTYEKGLQVAGSYLDAAERAVGDEAVDLMETVGDGPLV